MNQCSWSSSLYWRVFKENERHAVEVYWFYWRQLSELCALEVDCEFDSGGDDPLDRAVKNNGFHDASRLIIQPCN